MRGLQISWEPIVAATKYRSDFITGTAWSPCSRFIAISRSNFEIEILDGATLERLNTFKMPCPSFAAQELSFSPDSRLLTLFGNWQEATSWDLQTGGPAGTITIPSEPDVPNGPCFSSAYSMDGKMVAAAYLGPEHTIRTYNLLSGTQTYSYRVSRGHVVAPIWTHGESLRFVIVKPGSITIWEIAFTSIHTLVEVGSLPVPDDIGHEEGYLFLPTLSRLAFTLQDAVLVWDARDSKFLLDFHEDDQPTEMSFSPDGRFFACGTITLEIHLWKDSPTGYMLHQKVNPAGHRVGRSLLSPNGESIATVGATVLGLWHTTDPTPSLPTVQTQPIDWQSNFVLEFSPDETLAVVARLEANTVTVIDLRSGDTRLIVNTGMEVHGLRMTGGNVVVLGEGKVVTWNLPAGDHTPNARASVDDSVRTTTFNYSGVPRAGVVTPCMSISPDLNRIAITEGTTEGDEALNVYDVSSGKRLAGTATLGSMPWFAQNGHEIWCVEVHSVKGWTIVEDGESGLTRLDPLGPTTEPSGGLPWRSPRGYEVLDNGWVFNPSGKRSLWLPHYWISHEAHRMWGGRFLGLLHFGLPDAVILELDE